MVKLRPAPSCETCLEHLERTELFRARAADSKSTSAAATNGKDAMVKFSFERCCDVSTAHRKKICLEQD